MIIIGKQAMIKLFFFIILSTTDHSPFNEKKKIKREKHCNDYFGFHAVLVIVILLSLLLFFNVLYLQGDFFCIIFWLWS